MRGLLLAALAFVAYSEGVWQVFVQNGPSEPPRAVGNDLHRDAGAPRISPDGRRIAFEVRQVGIRVCSMDGGCRDIRPQTGWFARPAWLDSHTLVFARYQADANGEDSDLYRVDLNVGEPELLLEQTGSQDYPAVSPDGQWLLYTSTAVVQHSRSSVQVVRQLWRLDLRARRAEPFLTTTAQDLQPAVSPDGEQIAFASNRSGAFEIWTVQADATHLRRVTSGPGVKTWPAWSPDGRSIVFTRQAQGATQLWQLRVRGRKMEPYDVGELSSAPYRDGDWR